MDHMANMAALELSRLTIKDQISLATAVVRASHFNRDAKNESSIAVIQARWKLIESLIYQETARQEAEARGTDDRTVMRAALRIAVAALKEAEDQFMFYRRQHAAKGSPDGDVKAQTNQAFADRMARAIDEVRQHVGELSDG